jgi:hypothetical protein
MKYIFIRNMCKATFLAAITQVSGCTENVREQSPDVIAERVKHVLMPDQPDLAWFAPELHIRHYRTLFYGYDTVDYRLAAPEHYGDFRLLVDAHYSVNLRHYDFTKMADASTRGTSHHQHDTERCQIFNSLISSRLYRDRFSLDISRSDLEHARVNGLQLSLTPKTQDYERLDLPSNYIQGFVKAIENSESKRVQ